jgi:hypothetical protein
MSYHVSFHKKIVNYKEKKASIPVVDAHLHLVDFSQETEGLNKLITNMDKARIKKSVVFGLPVIKKWEYFEPQKPHYYLDDESKCYYYSATDFIVAKEYEKLSRRKKKRIAPLLCGFNPTDCSSINYIEKMFKEFPFWKGIGEVLLRHDDLTNLTQEEVARINHPACLPIYEFCAKKNLPILIHQNSTSIADKKGFLYLPEIEEVLKNFPKTKFVWAHCGISRRIYHPHYPKVLYKLFKKYENLFVDISWITYDEAICERLKPKKSWIYLIMKNPDRFLVGSDLCGHFDNIGKTMARYNSLFKHKDIDSKTAQMVAYENANNIFFK